MMMVMIMTIIIIIQFTGSLMEQSPQRWSYLSTSDAAVPVPSPWCRGGEHVGPFTRGPPRRHRVPAVRCQCHPCSGFSGCTAELSALSRAAEARGCCEMVYYE